MKLSQIARQLITSANLNPGGTVHCTLKNGLRLDLTLKRNEYHLCLSRPDVYPSAVEQQTVLRAWPEPLPPDADLRRYERRHERWHTIVLIWERPQ